MPLKYRILQDRKLVLVAGEGRITLDELLGHLETLARDPGYRAPMKKLIDYRHAELRHLTAADISAFTEKKASYRQVFNGEQCAIIAPDSGDYGMARMHGALIEGERIDFRVFRSLPEALAWLDIQMSEEELATG